ncbi:hypothetical protein MKW92_042568, partial [Papaver armeniacum]
MEMNANSAAEIVFFDLETTVPNQTGRRFWVISLGDLSMVSLKSGRSDGITHVADSIFDILDGRVWAGHNIQRFHCVRIKEAFADIGRPPPVPVGMMEFFHRSSAGELMASLADYLAAATKTQKKNALMVNRSLADVRMNLEVLKHCTTVLFLVYNL